MGTDEYKTKIKISRVQSPRVASLGLFFSKDYRIEAVVGLPREGVSLLTKTHIYGIGFQ